MTANELLVGIAIAVPMVGGAVAWPLKGRASDLVALGAGVVGLVATAILAILALTGAPVTGWFDLVRIDALGGWTMLVVAAVGLVALAASPGYLDRTDSAGRLRVRDRGLYWALLLWFMAGLAGAPMTDNLGLMWVAIEMTTIVGALLIGFARDKPAIEAAWKSLNLGSVGVGFALLGTLLAYASSVSVLGETSDALAWSRLVSIAPQLDPGLVRLAFVFVLVGYGTKAGLAPFHTWLPDAYSQAPGPVGAVLGGAKLAVAVYALARFDLVAAGALGPAFPSTLLVVLGLLSLAVALPFVVAQGDVKRLLAYSSVEHVGISVLALGFGGSIALAGLALHLLAHGLVKSSLFVSVGRLTDAVGSRHVGRLRGSLQRVPGDGRSFVAGSVLLSGLPPSALFVSEVAIVVGGFAAGWGWAAGIAALLLSLTVAGFLFHVVRLATGSAGERRDRTPGPRRLLRAGLVLVLPLLIVGVLGLWTPPAVQDAIQGVVAVLGSPS
ncbi:MAG: proton-conducting transporter membrane subunit [Chloroflexota bacterium]